MAKPIVLNDEMILRATREFEDSLRSMGKMLDGKVNFTRTISLETKERANVTFSADAFAKMAMLIMQFDSEVAWHGVAFRDETKKNCFYITDILVYPQIVTGSTVNTDQEAYTGWLYSLDDDVFNNVRMQGHSHVTTGVSPSGVDTTHQEKILQQVDDDMFYIFMIWNKKFERFVRIYDMKNNRLYDKDDVDVYIGSEGVDLNEFIMDAKAIVKKTTYSGVYNGTHSAVSQFGRTTTGTGTATAGGVSTVGKDSPKTPADTKTKEKPSIGYRGNAYPYSDEEFEEMCRRFAR